MVLKPEQIPPKVAAAAKKRISDLFSGCSYDCGPDSCSSWEFKKTGRCQCLESAAEVVASAISAWPDAWQDGRGGKDGRATILPMED